MTSPSADGDPDGPTARPRPLVCARCRTPSAVLQPATWTCSVENGVRQYFCDDCSRQNLRAIEGRLDSARW
ncbi:hypothetical protein [Streptomyces sp. NPDC001508]|uniref:hypothetical protein n=1 Tax=Streptomyces sp. NPDC001508 TaxID=3154656 RepID=UPI003326F06A